MASNQALTPISPACPIPRVWDPVQHLQRLKNSLDPNSPEYCFVEGMHINIRAVIAAYENGEMPTEGTVYFKHGRIVSESEGQELDALVWPEVCFLFLCPHQT